MSIITMAERLSSLKIDKEDFLILQSLQKGQWLKTATGKYARIIGIDKLTNRVEVTIHDNILSAIVLIDGSNTLDLPFSTVQSWKLYNPITGETT
jgi:hypothetical protein